MNLRTGLTALLTGLAASTTALAAPLDASRDGGVRAGDEASVDRLQEDPVVAHQKGELAARARSSSRGMSWLPSRCPSSPSHSAAVRTSSSANGLPSRKRVYAKA